MSPKQANSPSKTTTTTTVIMSKLYGVQGTPMSNSMLSQRRPCIYFRKKAKLVETVVTRQQFWQYRQYNVCPAQKISTSGSFRKNWNNYVTVYGTKHHFFLSYFVLKVAHIMWPDDFVFRKCHFQFSTCAACNSSVLFFGESYYAGNMTDRTSYIIAQETAVVILVFKTYKLHKRELEIIIKIWGGMKDSKKSYCRLMNVIVIKCCN